MKTKLTVVFFASAAAAAVAAAGCSRGSEIVGAAGGSTSGSGGQGTGGQGTGAGGATGSGDATGSGGATPGTGGVSVSTGGSGSGENGGSGSGTGGSGSPGSGGGGVMTGGKSGTGGASPGTGGTTGSGGAAGSGSGSGGAAGSGPIKVLIWNTALVYGHAARVTAIPELKKRESTDNISFDTSFAHTGSASDGPSDQSFDASVFTDAGLDKYDVVFFLDTTGNTIDDSMKTVRRQALQDFIEKKGRGFVGTHSATDTYQGSAWPWYVDFMGANFQAHSNAGTSGTAVFYQNMTHPILTAAATPNPWNRQEEWYTFTRDPLSSKIAGIKILLTCHDNSMTQERDSAWVHEMPLGTGATRAGRMFYTAFGHDVSAFKEKAVMDMIIAGIKWAAYRL